MKYNYLLLSILILSGCMNTSEISHTNEKSTQKLIQNNKTEAQKAQNDYKKLQEERNKK